MSTLSPSRSHLAVFGGAGVPDAAIDHLHATLEREREHRDTPLHYDHLTSVCVHLGPRVDATATRQAVHVSVDLPEIVVSPVIDAPGAICLRCYQRRRHQHNSDPRLEDTGTMPLLQPRVAGLPISAVALTIVARQVLASIEGWAAGGERRHDFSLYRTSLNQLSVGRVMPHANCSCGVFTSAEAL